MTREEIIRTFEYEIVESYAESDEFYQDYADECFGKDEFIVRGEHLTIDDVPESFKDNWVENYRGGTDE